MRPKHQPTLKALAESYATSQRTLSRARSEGINIEDRAAFRRWQRDQQSDGRKAAMVADDDEPGNATYDELRNRRTKAQAELLEHDLAVKRREFLPVSEVTEGITRAVAALQAGIARMEGELPGIVEGLTAGQCAKRIRAYGDDLICRLRDDLRELR